MNMTSPIFPYGAITDEFSPNLDVALDAMAGLGMTTVELRVIEGRNIIDFADDDLDAMRRTIERRGMRVISIASPVFKCELPDSPPLDPRLQRDVFGKQHSSADQAQLSMRALDIAERMGASIVRVFSFWRTVEPPATFDRVGTALRELADRAATRGLTIGLENEHACNVATGAESAALLKAAPHPALKIIWDPANALVVGERAFPDGYGQLAIDDICHVHAKDCRVVDHKPIWGALGAMDVNWPAQIAALVRDGYRGAINLETHWTGPHGDKLEASRICGATLRDWMTSGR